MTADNHVCAPLVDESGQVVARARVSPDIGEDGMRALARLVEAARRLQAEQVAADPATAAERERRQVAGIARIRERARRRGESE